MSATEILALAASGAALINHLIAIAAAIQRAFNGRSNAPRGGSDSRGD